MQLFVGVKGIIHYQGNILLLRESNRYVDGAEEGKWDVPGGRIEPHEKMSEGLFREVREESGLEIKFGRLLGAFDGFPKIKGEECHVVRMYFLCEAVTNEVTLSQDHDRYDWINPTDIGDKVLVNDIQEMLDETKKYL